MGAAPACRRVGCRRRAARAGSGRRHGIQCAQAHAWGGSPTPSRSPPQLAPARSAVEADPWNDAAWDDLLALLDAAAERRGGPASAKAGRVAALTAYTDRFPTHPDAWRRLASAAAGDDDAVRGVYARCLLGVPDAALWRGYARFVADHNAPRGGDAGAAAETRAAYECAVRAVGADARAGGLWGDYLGFLSRPLPGSPLYTALFGAVPGQEASARTVALRAAYHKAIVVPAPGLEGVWRQYEAFEGASADRDLAKRALDDARPRYIAARAAWRDRERLLDPIVKGPGAGLAPLPPGRGGARQAAAARAWRALLAWEASNPQSLDPAPHAARVLLAYSQALLPLALYPDVWAEAAAWAGGDGGDVAAARSLLERGRAMLPGSPLLVLAAADLEEDAGDAEAATGVYEGALSPLAADDAAAAGPSPSPARAGGGSAGPSPKEGGEGGGGETAAAAAAPPPPPSPLTPDDATLLWAHYMHFARRTAGLRAARRVFMRARKAPGTGWRAFAVAAAIEWDADAKPQVPRNIYELGMRAHAGDGAFVARYASFLRSVGDANNARSIFERALGASPPPPLPDETAMWDAYVAFEREAGGPGAAAGVAARRRGALAERAAAAAAASTGGPPPPPPPGDALRLALAKYTVEGQWPLSGGAREAVAEVLGGVGGGGAGPLPSGPAPPPRRRSPPPPMHRPGDRDRPPPGLPAPPRPGPPRPHPAGPPPAVAALLADLPPAAALLAEGGPLPDVDRLLDVLLSSGLVPGGGKRGLEGERGGGDRGAPRARVG